MSERVSKLGQEHDDDKGQRAASSSSTVSDLSDSDTNDDVHMRRGNVYLRVYDRYRRTYRVQKPSSDKGFIRRFLSRLDDGQARHTQNKLLRAFPDLVVRRDTPKRIGKSAVTEIVELDKLTWLQVATVIASMTEDDFKLMAVSAGHL